MADTSNVPKRLPGGGFFPGRAPIDAYGDGGFRFADMSHQGSLLCLPGGVHAWHVASAQGLAVANFDAVIAERDDFDFLLLGTGALQVFPDDAIRALFDTHNLGLDAMSTGAAARCYNVLLAEGRRVAAALIAVP